MVVQLTVVPAFATENDQVKEYTTDTDPAEEEVEEGQASDEDEAKTEDPGEENAENKDAEYETAGLMSMDDEETDDKDQNSPDELELVSVRKTGGEAYFTDIEVVFPGDDYDRLIDESPEYGGWDDMGLMSSGGYWDKFSCNYFYDQMSYDEQCLYDQLYAINYSILTTDVDITIDPVYSDGSQKDDDGYLDVATTSLGRAEMLKVARVFRLENPQFYFLNTTIIHGHDSGGNNYVAIGVYDKFINGDDRADETEYVRDTIDRWYDEIAQDSTDLAKEVYIQNKIVDSIIYDPRVSAGGDPKDELVRYNQSCYSVLGQDTRYTVCAGYAQTFALLANGLDIDTVAITSYSHEWNKIKLYGRWYLTDVTWDDTGTDGSYRYKHFNISESYMDSIDQYMSSYPGKSYNIDGDTVSFSRPKDHDEMTAFTGYGDEYTYLWPEDQPAAGTNVGSDKESAYSSYGGYSSDTDRPVIAATGSGDTYTVTITCGTAGASIYYVTYDEDSEESGEPSESYSKSMLYSGSFTVEKGTVVKAIACRYGYNDSEIAAILAGTHSSSAANTVSSVTSVDISDTSRTVAIAESFRLHAYARPTYADAASRRLYWFTSDDSVLSVEASPSNPDYATIKGLKAGTATVTASTSSTNSGSVKAECIVTVTGSSVAINRIKVTDGEGNSSSDINLTEQTSVSLSASVNTGADGTGQLAWSCDEDAVTLEPLEDTLECIAICNEPVSAVITATAGNGVKGIYSVNFYRPAEGLEFDETDVYWEAPPANKRYLYSFSVNILGESTEVVTWSTEDPEIADIYSYNDNDAQHKTVKIVVEKPGDTVITASIPSGSSASCNLHVYDVPVESVSIVDSEGNTYTSDSDYKKVPKGDEFILRAVVTPDDADYPDVCEWDVWGYNTGNIRLTDNKDGTCNIKVLGGFSSGTTYTTYIRVCTYNYKYSYFYIHPYIPVTSVSLKDSDKNASSTRGIGDTFDITATLNSDYDKDLADTDLTWTSSDDTIAAVSVYSSNNKKATVTAKGNGTAEITATASNGVSGRYIVSCRMNHTVTFEANGGTCDVSSVTVADGEVCGELPIPNRTGYDFAGWYTAETGGTKASSTDIVTADMTLYAHWTARTYTLTLNANGGECSVESISVTYGSVYGSLPAPIRAGYTFDSWWTAASGGTRITEASKVTLTADATLYAHWSAESYSVTFDAKGGMCDVTSIEVSFDREYGELPVPSKSGYGFEGWYTKDSGGDLVSADTLVHTAGDHTLYAQWSVGKYTVTFDPNSGECDTPSKSVEYNSSYGELPSPARDGYTFIGWYTDANSGENITAETIVAITSDQTLYAHWSADSYDLIFDPNGGECSGTSKSVTYDDIYGELPEAVRRGYTFTGWYTAVDGGDNVTAETKVGVTAAQTLYAHWEADSYTVTFDANGGTVDGRSTAVYTITYDSAYGELPEAVRQEYDFAGWFTDMTDGVQITSDVTCKTPGDITLYAHWTDKHYTVTFNANGGSFDDESTTASASVVFNGVYGTMPIPAKEGSEFTGWYTQADGGTCVSENTRFSKDITTLYAHWNIFHTVTFDANGGLFDSKSESTTEKVMDGERIGDAILAGIGIPACEEKDFAGWYTDDKGTYLFDAGNTEIYDDIILYAGWESRYEGFRIEGLDKYYEYTGAAIKPDINVSYYDSSYGDRTLVPGRDYTVSYKNNTNAAAADAVNAKGVSIAPSVTVKGKGDYTGTITETFTIHPRDVGEAYVDFDSEVSNNLNAYHISLTYNGKDQKLAPKLRVNLPTGKTVTLSKGKDYTLSQDTVKDTGNYEIEVIGTGNYTFSRTLRVRVSDKTVKAISKVKIPAIPDQVYDEDISSGKAYSYILTGTPDGKEKRAVDKTGNTFNWVLTDSSVKPAYTLVEDVDYQLEYDDNDTVGTAAVTIIGMGNYSGNIKKTFKITGIAMSKVTVPKSFETTTNDVIIYDSKTKKFHYTGQKIKPAGSEEGAENCGIKLTYKANKNADTEELEKGKDYTVSYQKNIEPGTATVIFTGTGKYTGTVKRTFAIQGYDIAKDVENSWDRISVTLPDEDYKYVKGGVKPEPVVKFTSVTLVKGTDYTLSWKNNTKPADAGATDTKGVSIAPTVIVTGKGRYTGKLTKTFTITNGELNDALTATDIVFKANTTSLYGKTKITVTDSGGQVLKAGTDYYAAGDRNYPFTYVYKSFTDSDGNNSKKGSVTVKEGKDWSDMDVSAGEPVEKTHCIPSGTVISVTVHGKGYYEGQEATGTFMITGNDFTKAKIAAIPAQTYTGKAIEPETIAEILSGNYVTFKVDKTRTDTLSCGVAGKDSDENTADCLITSVTGSVDVGTAKVTVKGNPAKGYAGEKTVTFKITAKPMNHTIVYDNNPDDGNNNPSPDDVYGGLVQALLVKDPSHDEDYYKANYRITGAMKNSSTPLYGKLTANAYKVQKLNEKGRWVEVPASEICFSGWNTKPDGSGRDFVNQGVFAPTWLERLLHGNETWTLYAQWK